MPKNNLANHIHLHFIIFIWGFTAVLGKLISIDAVPLVWFRLLIASIVLLIFLVIKKEKLSCSKIALTHFLFGGVIIGLHWLTFFYAIKVSNISITLTALATGAVFTSILEPLFLNKKIVFYELLFSSLTVVGIIIIFNVEAQFKFGIIIALISAFLSASFSILNSIYVKKYDVTVLSFYELLFALLTITIILLYNQSFSIEFFNLSTNDWLYISILGTICTAYALTASTKLLKHISPFTMMLTINLEPVYGIILALIVFGDSEKMQPNFYYGAILIFVMVILNGIISTRKKQD
jgi:drug/metabolite transporter (DMT)-like permease